MKIPKKNVELEVISCNFTAHGHNLIGYSTCCCSQPAKYLVSPHNIGQKW